MVTYKILSAISRMFSINLPRLLAVTFHISSVHSLYTMMSDMSLHPYPKGSLTGCQISIPPFDMTSHPLARFQISVPEKNVHVPDHIHDQKMSKEVRGLPKLTVDDKASSKTHLVRLMHNVVTSKFKIFSVAKARCWNTRLSPKTPKVLPVQSSSSKIQFLG